MVHACPQTQEGKKGFMLKRLKSWVTMNLWAFKQLVMKKYENHENTTWRSSWCFRVPMGHHTRFGRDEQWLAPALGEARCFSPMKLSLKAQKVILSIYWKTTPQGRQKHPIWQWQRSGDFEQLDSNRHAFCGLPLVCWRFHLRLGLIKQVLNYAWRRCGWLRSSSFWCRQCIEWCIEFHHILLEHKFV